MPDRITRLMHEVRRQDALADEAEANQAFWDKKTRMHRTNSEYLRREVAAFGSALRKEKGQHE